MSTLAKNFARVVEQCESLSAERDALRLKCETLTAERDALQRQRLAGISSLQRMACEEPECK